MCAQRGREPSFFAFGALSADKGIEPPAFQVRGVAGGMGWRSHLRLPDGPDNVPDFPFIKALDDPRAIGAKPDGSADPLAVLEHLTQGDKPWVRPAHFDRLYRLLLAELHAADGLDWSRACVDTSRIRAKRRG
ncbi:DUF6603 domain-containing protein [Streptomyces broussonetiae]|uniref:DUF6603 domain-containing protein n=1 Tax=Streptomyces broussonetiae TaxID=2686304 RepID=UPI0035D864A8